MIICLVLALFVTTTSAALYHHQNHGTHNYYVLHHDPAYASLSEVVDLLGLQIVEPIGELKDIWLARIPRNNLDSRGQHGEAEVDDPVVETYRRMRRQTLLSRRGEDMSLALRHLSRQVAPQKRVTRAPFSSETTASSHAKRAPVEIKDPLYNDQWSLKSLNVPKVWEKGHTGKGIVIAIMDDGVRSDHKDLKYAAEHSYDFVTNSKTQPTDTQALFHGTGSAGIIAAARNDLCGVGIAYDSKVSSLRIVGGTFRGTGRKHQSPNAEFSMREALAFNYHYDSISIYSCGYGPADDGKTIDGPKYVGKQALLNGVNKGRGGKGSIFVFAAGNGGDPDKEHDDCNYDGYVNSIYTIAIGAVDKSGKDVKYSEPCAAVMATVYSSADDNSSSIVSLGSGDDVACESNFGQTSAAAPAAAAIFALALEARPDLTWRDIQHLCVETAQFPQNVYSDSLVNGRKYKPKIGFGVLDASIFVEKAKTWPLAKPQVWMEPPYVQFEGGAVNDRKKVTGGERLVDGNTAEGEVIVTERMVREANFDKIEHIQVRVWVEHEKRGDIEVTLFNPKKIVCALATKRPRDTDTSGLMGWTFTTVKHWGEDPVGKWEVVINDQSTKEVDKKTGKVLKTKTGKALGFSMTFWGNARNGDNTKPYTMPPDDLNVFPPPSAVYQIPKPPLPLL